MSVPLFRTERLIIRTARPSEASLVVQYLRENRAFHAATEPVWTEPHYTANYWERQLATQEKPTMQNGYLSFYLFAPDERKIVGNVVLFSIVRSFSQSAFIGYALAESAQGRGLMHEAMTAVVAYAFGPMNLHRLNAGYQEENVRSANVLRKLGFQVEGCAKRYLLLEGRWQDVILAGLINEHWQPLDKVVEEEGPAAKPPTFLQRLLRSSQRA